MGARALLALGYDPEETMTIRHAGKDYDSFIPMPIGALANWTMAERDRGGLKRECWRSPPTPEQRLAAERDLAA
jgi:hypothetical protein